MRNTEAGDESPSSASHGDYSVGSIKSIELWDFVIHEYLYYPCSSRINFLIGANGTGKSTIVCAICLGLGGETSYMERSKSLQDFIRHGCTSATIQIVLQNYPGEPDLVIKRVLQKGSSNASTWYIMGRHATAKDVRDLLAKLKIQISNPTQFLPQERISEFSKLVPQDMLRYVLLSVDEKLLEKRNNLMDLEAKQKEMTNLLRNRESVLREKRQRRDALESVLAEVELRRKLEGEIELIQYAQLLSKKKALEQERSEEQRTLDEIDSQLSALTDEMTLLQAVHDCDDALRIERMSRQTKEKEYTYALSRLQRAHEDVRARRRVITNKLEEYQSLNIRGSIENEMMNMEASIKQTEEALARSKESYDEERLQSLERDETELTNRYRATDRQLQDLTSRRAALERETVRLTAQAENVVDLRSVKRRKVVSYDRSSSNAMQSFEAMLKLETQGRFQRPIFGPLIAEVECDSMYANAIEACIPAWLQRAFLSQTYPDLQHLNQVVVGSTIFFQHDKAEATIETAKQRSRATPQDVERIRREAGLIDLRYAHEVVQADKVVLGAIFANSGFANALITTDPDFEKKINNVLSRYEGQSGASFVPPGVSIFSTHLRSLSFRPNKFTAGSYYVSMSNRPSAILNQVVDNSAAVRAAERLQHLNQELETIGPKQRSLKDELEAFKSNHESIQRELARQRAIRADIRRITGKLNSQKEALETLQTQLRDERNLRPRQEKLALEIKKLQISTLRETTKMATYISEAAIMYGRLASQIPTVVKAENDLEKATREHKLWKRQHEQLLGRKQQVEHQILLLSREIRAVQSEYDAVTAAISDSEKLSFLGNLPQSIVELETLLEEKKELLRAIHFDRASVEEFERVQREILELEAQVDESGTSTSQLEKDIQDLKHQLVTAIQSIAETLHTHFVEYLNLIHAKGAVVFDDKEAVQNWGLKVMVSFSQGRPISTLQSTTFSGGERAIATMLVLMALQSVSSVPFRVIDEINQGMDVVNERVVMETLVSGIADTDTNVSFTGADENLERGKQLFIVSPKLLPRLKHAEVLHTTIVFNGPILQESKTVQDFFSQFSSFAQSSRTGEHSASTADYFDGHRVSQRESRSATSAVGRKRALEA